MTLEELEQRVVVLERVVAQMLVFRGQDFLKGETLQDICTRLSIGDSKVLTDSQINAALVDHVYPFERG